jgi:hypothetical protein
MRRLPFALAAAALALGLLAGCGNVPAAPPSVPSVEGTSTETPAPVVPPSDFAASSSGSWSGYWTWTNGKWVWTWVWYDNSGGWVAS